ncbi:hypothetical protein BFJ65_g13726 [Fusarium oxysporum f. sp. cepae]|uniref:MULE transposase domain-containing protein n=1 Tax=Fusarium oxysporum f. sp. cepae TaxID=396571 RepID=A0A3L6N345_FUSOX|nr:hypothetical protein BFJ65_g13726 [Fusarium oxysporum f. sp. cepae]
MRLNHLIPTHRLGSRPPKHHPLEITPSPLRISSSPAPDLIPNPPIPGDIFPTIETLFESVNTFAKANGFGITRYNGYSYKGRKIQYSLRCDRYRDPRPNRGAGLRQRKSRKCGYKWMVIVEALEEGKWVLRQHSNPEHSQHNHGRSIRPSAHPSHRRLTTPVRATIKSTSRRVGIRARDVRAVVQEQHPELAFTQRDIYNARARINRDKLNGHTPTAALIKLFDEIDIPYVATGQTCLGSVFNAAFGLIDNERRKGFQFLSESIRQLTEQHSIRQPDVIITDFDDQMKAALNDQFPDVQQQLCIYHINSNVLLKSKQKWVEDLRSSSSPDNSNGEEFTVQARAELSPQDK